MNTKTAFKTIRLTNGGLAFVDAADFDALSAYEWHDHDGYACRWIPHPELPGRQALIRMHRELVGLDRSDPLKVDHDNGNTLDNRRGNLRSATSAQNGANQSVAASSTTGLKGASLCRKRNCYQSKIRINGRQRFLGYFKTADEAHAAYMTASREVHGEFHNPCKPATGWWGSLQFKKLRAVLRAGSKRIAALKRAPRTAENAEVLRALWKSHDANGIALAEFVLSQPIARKVLSEESKRYMVERGVAPTADEIAWLEGRVSYDSVSMAKKGAAA